MCFNYQKQEFLKRMAVYFILGITTTVFFAIVVPRDQEKNRQREENIIKEIREQEKQTEQVYSRPLAGATLAMSEMGNDANNLSYSTDIIEKDYPVIEIPSDTGVYYTKSTVNMRAEPDISSQSVLVSPQSSLINVVGFNYDYTWALTDEDLWVKAEFIDKFDDSVYMVNTSLSYTTQDVVMECLSVMNLDADKYDIYGLIWTESRGIQTTVGADGDSGYMQIIPSTWESCYELVQEDFPQLSKKYLVNDPFDAESNIVVGCYVIYRVMQELGVDSYQTNKSMILTSYNRGVGNAREYYKNTGSFVSEYSQSVIKNANYIRQHNTWEGI